ncbi:hypothetical protein QQ045_030146 [Rhodiola kirilowii]
MLLKAAPPSALLNQNGDGFNPFSPYSSQIVRFFPPAKERLRLVAAASKNSNIRPLSGVVFEPFEEVKKELSLVPTVPQDSLARHKFSVEGEAAVNEQINNAILRRSSYYYS